MLVVYWCCTPVIGSGVGQGGGDSSVRTLCRNRFILVSSGCGARCCCAAAVTRVSCALSVVISASLVCAEETGNPHPGFRHVSSLPFVCFWVFFWVGAAFKREVVDHSSGRCRRVDPGVRHQP